MIFSNELKEKLKQIGQDVASVYGGEHLGTTYDPINQKASFSCIEHGEHFIAEMSFNDIKTEYDLDLNAIFNKKPE